MVHTLTVLSELPRRRSRTCTAGRSSSSTTAARTRPVPLPTSSRATHPNVRILHHRVNFLLGQALRYAFNSTDADYVAVMDCDLSYDVDHLGRMLYAIQDSKARIVIASPYAKGGETTNIPFGRRVLSRGANWLFRARQVGS